MDYLGLAFNLLCCLAVLGGIFACFCCCAKGGRTSNIWAGGSEFFQSTQSKMYTCNGQNDSAILHGRLHSAHGLYLPTRVRHLNDILIKMAAQYTEKLTYKLFINAALSCSCPDIVLQCTKRRIETCNGTYLDISQVLRIQISQDN